MKRKNLALMGALAVSVLVLGNPIHADAFCYEWGETLGNRTYYCTTPVCHTGNRTEFYDTIYERECKSGLFQTRTEYQFAKVDNGCCPNN